MKTYIPSKPCKRGHSLRYTKGGECVTCAIERAAVREQKLRQENPEKLREQARVRAARHRTKPGVAERDAAYTREWRKKNAAKAKALRKEGKMLLINRIPPWADEKERAALVEFYKNTPEGHDVDHVIPLRGKNVSGFHHTTNLQYLPSKENRQKSNKF